MCSHRFTPRTRAPVPRACLVCNSLRKFETPPTIPRQEIEKEGKKEVQDRERQTQQPSAVGRGDGAGNTGSPLHRLTRQPVFQFRTPHLTPTGVRGHSKGHYFRRSRQNGWLGTRVRESQMTCVCVRVTTSSEVVHRRHRDDRGEEHEGQRKQINMTDQKKENHTRS